MCQSQNDFTNSNVQRFGQPNIEFLCVPFAPPLHIKPRRLRLWQRIWVYNGATPNTNQLQNNLARKKFIPHSPSLIRCEVFLGPYNICLLRTNCLKAWPNNLFFSHHNFVNISQSWNITYFHLYGGKLSIAHSCIVNPSEFV
jgi:hypothetical protein